MTFNAPLNKVSQQDRDFIHTNRNNSAVNSNNTLNNRDQKSNKNVPNDINNINNINSINSTHHVIDVDNNINIPILLQKIYISTKILKLSTETRYISFAIFYRYLCQYQIQYNIYIRNCDNDTGTNTGTGTGTGTGTVRSTKMNNNSCSDSTHNNIHESFLYPQHHLGEIAAATLFLACKISNENRRIRDVINVHHMLQFSDGNHNYHRDHDCDHDHLNVNVNADNDINVSKIQNGKHNQDKNTLKDTTLKDNSTSIPTSIPTSVSVSTSTSKCIINCHHTPPPLDEEYWKFKEKIVTVEHHLLRVLNFDVCNMTISPYRIVVTVMEQIIILVVDVNVDIDEDVNMNVDVNMDGDVNVNMDVNPSGDIDSKQNENGDKSTNKSTSSSSTTAATANANANASASHNSTNDNKTHNSLSQLKIKQVIKTILKIAWRRINDALFDIDAMAMKNSDLACGALQLAIEEVMMTFANKNTTNHESKNDNNEGDDNQIKILLIMRVKMTIMKEMIIKYKFKYNNCWRMCNIAVGGNGLMLI